MFSNGPIWVQLLAQSMGAAIPAPADVGGRADTLQNALVGQGLSTAAATRFVTGLENAQHTSGSNPYLRVVAGAPGGTDFAIGGSFTGITNENRGAAVPMTDLAAQLGNFKASVAGPVATALYTVWSGANDLLLLLQDPSLATLTAAGAVAADIGASVANEVAMVANLVAGGAASVLVLNVPDLGKLPALTQRGTAAASAASTLAATFNQELASALGGMNFGMARVMLEDIYGIIDDAVARPAGYGLSNVIDPVYTGVLGQETGTLASADPATQNHSLFFDHEHPTETGHLAIAQGAQAALAATYFAGVTLRGTHNDYRISPQQDGTLLVQDRIAGRDGTIHTSRFATLAFADGRGIGDTTGTAGSICRIYQAAFARPADGAGVQYWANTVQAGSLTLGGVAEAFTHTPEFIGGDGALNDIGYVQTLYQNVLGRTGDASAINYWTNTLAGGTDRGQVLIDFANSDENRARTLPMNGDLNAAEAARLYQAAFNREADTTGAQFWTAALDNGAPPLAVAQGFAASAEFTTLYAGLETPAYIGRLYVNVLHRAGEPTGVQFWQGQIANGATYAQVLLGFADSTENRIGTSTTTHDGWVFLG